MTPGPDNPFVKRKRWNQHLQAIHKDPSVLPLPYAQMSELGKALFDAGIGHAVSVDYGHLQVDNPDQELTNLHIAQSERGWVSLLSTAGAYRPTDRLDKRGKR